MSRGRVGSTTEPAEGPARLAAKIPNAPASLVGLRTDVRRFLADRGVSERASYATDLVLEELVGNMLRHAFQDGDEQSIEVEVLVAPKFVIVRLGDAGRPFDPTRHPEPARPASLAHARVGGRGISMVRAAVHSMTYRRDGGRNRLELEIAR